MKWLIHSLLALSMMVLLTAFSAVDKPLVYVEDLDEERRVDTLALSRRHSEAVKSLAIWQDTTKAERLWRGIIAEDSLYAPALYSLSRLNSVKADEVVNLARRAYEVDSSNKWYAQHYGEILVTRGDLSNALGVYRRLMALDSHDVSSYYYLARIYALRGMPYSAIAVLDSADMRLGRNSYLARIKQGLLLELRLFDRAIAEGERLLFDTPYDVQAHIDLATAYEAAGRDSMAMQTLESAHKLDTTNINATVALLDFYIRQNNVERVFYLEELLFRDDRQPFHLKLKHVKAFVDDENFYRNHYFNVGRLIFILATKYPTDREVVKLYSIHLFFGERYDEAVDYLMRHLEDDNAMPNDFSLAYELATILKRDKLADSIVNKAIERFPGDIDIASLAAYVRYSDGDTAGAIKVYRRALKSAPNDVTRSLLWCSIGDMYHEEDDNIRAFKAYDKALEYNPENAAALNNYAYFLALENRELERALAMSQLAITIEEGNYNYLDTYAWILHLLGRNVEAKKYMVQALALNRQQSASLLVHYADILWDLGEKFMAETYWKKAIEKGYDAEELGEHVMPRLLEEELSSDD